MPGFGSISPGMVGGARPQNSVLSTATQAAKNYRDQLGLPSFNDIWDRVTGAGGGTREYGNAGAAGEGAQFARNEISNFRGDLAAQQAQLAARRHDMANPTGTEGFKSVMRLTNERLAHGAENADRLANEAASRRGFVGGYNPARTERDRLEELATAGYEAADKERGYQKDAFGQEADLYKAGLAGYGSALNSYTDLTKTMAELPTKYLDAYSNLLGGIGGGFGDLFGTALKGAMYEQDPARQSKALREKYALEQQAAEVEEQRRRQAGEYDFQTGQQRAPQAARTQANVTGILDPRQAFLRQQQQRGIPTGL